MKAGLSDGSPRSLLSGSRTRAAEQGAAAGELDDPQVRVSFFRDGARLPLEVIVDHIDAHRQEYGVEPICRQLTAAGAYNS